MRAVERADVVAVPAAPRGPQTPLLPADPIVNSVPDRAARESMTCSYEPDLSKAEYAMGYRWDIVLRGRDATPTERA